MTTLATPSGIFDRENRRRGIVGPAVFAFTLLMFTCFAPTPLNAQVPSDAETYQSLSGRMLQSGDRALTFTPETISGKEVDLSAYQGKKVVVFAFWLNSCDVCNRELKKLQKLVSQKKYAGKVAVFTVTRAANKFEVKEVKREIADEKITFPVLKDPDLFITKMFNVTTAPSFVLIDRNGRLVNRPVAHVDVPQREMTFADFIDYAVQGKPIPPLQLTKPSGDDIARALVGKKAPEFSLKGINGESFAFSGKPAKKLVVAFWHPDSKICEEPMKRFNEYVREKAAAYNFDAVSVASLYGDQQLRSARAFAEENALAFPVLVDHGSKAGELYNIKNIPTVYVIGVDGKIFEMVTSKSVDNMAESLEAIFKSIK